MGKRKSTLLKPPSKKKNNNLPKEFDCLFCNAKKPIQISLQKKAGVGDLVCTACGQRFQTPINYLSAQTDVYFAWVDACDEVAKQASERARDGEDSGDDQIDDDDEEDEDDEDVKVLSKRHLAFSIRSNQLNRTVNADIQSHGLLTREEKDSIERDLGGINMDTCGDMTKAVREALLQKTHFGFDLDDTLHEFRKASGAASVSVFKYLADHNATTLEELKETYARILAKATSGAFAGGKTSEDCRRERFAALMAAHKIETTKETMQYVLGLYRASLQAGLSLKSGAAELFSKLKGMGKTIILVIERPEDSQTWTVEELGIAYKLDVLIMSDKFGRTKTDGLLGEALTELGVEAKDFALIGDNMAQDIAPAREAGMMAIHYSESENVRLELGEFRINSLWKLSELLTSSENQV
ncbi:MAG: hypothetical protein Q9216_004465 [Gyalolechia sp. 2 TL-2023]